MAVNSISGLGSNANATSGATANANDPVSQRNLFMTLLVAQLKNQDPLQPQDGTAFVAQLAQFNSLDQLVGIRQSIESLTAAMAKNTGTSTTTTTPTTTPPASNPTTPRDTTNTADLG